MYLRKLRLGNIREFDDFEIELSSDMGGSRAWTVVIGANGIGKTTLLRAIAIGLAPESDANAMLASPIGAFVKQGKRFGDIELTVRDGTGPKANEIQLRTVIKATKGRESIRRDPPEQPDLDLPLFGYGISRVRSGRGEHRDYRIYDSTRTLFDYDAELVPVELTIRRIRDFLGKAVYGRAMTGIKRVLDLPDSTTITVDTGGGVVIQGGPIQGQVPLQGWADGYRLNLTWIADVFGTALLAGALTKRGGIRGVLLLDELEQHTHPSIQIGSIARIKALWPELQVVGTTHSPLVVLGAEADEVVVLRRAEGRVALAPGANSFAGYSAEDILEDERLFDTSTKRPEMKEALSSYEQLAAIPVEQRTSGQKSRLRELAESLDTKSRSDAADSPLLREIRALREKYQL